MAGERIHRERVVVAEVFDWDGLEKTLDWVRRSIEVETKVSVRGEDSSGQFEAASVGEARAHVAQGGGELVLLNVWVEPHEEDHPLTVRFHYWKPLTTKLHVEVEGSEEGAVRAFASSLGKALARGLPAPERQRTGSLPGFDWGTVQTMLKSPRALGVIAGLILLLILLRAL